MKYLHLTLYHPPEQRNPMREFVMEHDDLERAELLNWNLSHPEYDYLLFRIVGDPEPYAAALDESPLIRAFDVTTLDDESFYAYLEHEKRDVDGRFRAAFAETSLLVVPPIVYTGEGAMAMEIVGRPADMQGTMDDLPADIEVDVDQVGEYDASRVRFTSLLTDRQRESLAAAVETGYYDVPRTGTVEDVAAELDCAPSTASTHLRKAESRIVQELVA
ncbi:helix-turn-helix domain-containing protein [Halomicrococcus gelatinilyticus]|uniref:helix-turn-helix domain-containing protein n=1 Tax=Halomicrococcus gelatinilyticus TaxID=1702103 RepID=UPI002E1363A5